MQTLYRITDIRAFENYSQALEILGAKKVGDVIAYKNLPIFDILIERNWVVLV